MVFVHARNATARTAMVLREMASQRGQLKIFQTQDQPQYGLAYKSISRSHNKQLVELFSSGFAVHHAGMLRSDR